jgi:hypothetical protein
MLPKKKNIPPTSKWKELSKKHGAPDGGVTKALDAYWNSGASTPQKYLVAYTNLEKALATYITKVDKDAKGKKKITDYAGFQKLFLDEYLGVAHMNVQDTKRGMAGIQQLKEEIVKYMRAVQMLSLTKATAVDLGSFKSGPARGLGAMETRVRGLTVEQLNVARAIRAEVTKIDAIVDHMPPKTTQTQINGYVKQIIVISEAIRKIAKKGGMLL